MKSVRVQCSGRVRRCTVSVSAQSDESSCHADQLHGYAATDSLRHAIASSFMFSPRCTSASR